MATYSNTAREVEMPNGDVVVIHNAPTGGENTTSNIKKFKYDDNGHVTESTAANATDLNLNSYSTPTTGSTAIGTSDAVQTAIGKLDHQSQIDQTNILYAINNGVKNELDNFGTTSHESSGVTFTFNKDGSVHIKGTATGANATFYYYTGTYSYISNIYKGHILSGVTGGAEGTYGLLAQYSSNGTSWATQEMCKTTPITIKSDYNYINICIIVFSGQTVDTTIYPMLCDPTVWAQSHDFMPPALPNYDLTYLQAEDRAALAEEIDAGAKQLAQGQNNSGSAGTATIQSDGYTVKLTGSAASSSSLSFASTGTIQKTGTYVFAIEASGTMDRISIWDNTASASVETLYATGSKEVTLTAGHSYALFHFAGSAMTLNVTVKYMICTKAAFGVSKAFVPYRPNYDLVAMGNWSYHSYEYTTTAADTYEYTGISFSVPAHQVYEFIAMDRKVSSSTLGIIVADNNQTVTSPGSVSVIAENSQTFTTPADKVWGRQVHGMTAVHNADNTFYIWVKRASAAKNVIQLAYRRIY